MYKVEEIKTSEYEPGSLKGLLYCVCWETLETPHAIFLNRSAAEGYMKYRNSQM